MRVKPSRQLQPGQKVEDPREHLRGVVVDSARQYAHPKAPPVYSYLVRWDDGQVRAYSEAAFLGEDGLREID